MHATTSAEAQLSSAGLPCWCAAGAWRRRFRTRRFGLLRCTACGTYRIDPVPVADEAACADFYTRYYHTVGADSRPNPNGSRAGAFWKVVARYPALDIPRRCAADIGCGEGHLCAELRANGWPCVVGVELSHTRVERARRFYPGIRFVEGSLSQAGLGSHFLDLALLENVIEHLPNPRRILDEIRESLAPGGRLVLMTPNMDSGDFRFLGRRWTGMLAPHAHVFLFTGAALCSLLGSCGFEVETCGSIYADPYSLRAGMRRFFSADIKGALWRAYQELGARCGRLLRAGPILYAVAREGVSRR